MKKYIYYFCSYIQLTLNIGFILPYITIFRGKVSLVGSYMKCPFCSFNETKVLETREDENSVKRRRECSKCGKRFTTYERAEFDIIVKKKDNVRESFDRKKLLSGIMKALEKRPVSANKIEKLVDSIEDEIRKLGTKEIESTIIGEIVMDKLKKIDKVAYIRFASVYRSFEDIDSFKEEIESLSGGNKNDNKDKKKRQ